MTIVSDDPRWWPAIDSQYFRSYFAVASFVVVMYDWVLTFGQEVELIWRQRWSLMTVLYLSMRYLGIIDTVLGMLDSVLTILLTDAECRTIWDVCNWMGTVVYPILWVIIVARLYAMYQGSRKILIFLIVTCLAVIIYGSIVVTMETMDTLGEELILSGTHVCAISTGYGIFVPILLSMVWILSIAWEVLTLCFALWIAVKHFCELRHHSAGGIIGDCFTVLMTTHIFYFASFVAVSCFNLVRDFSPTLLAELSLDGQVCSGILLVLRAIQAFVLGPRLILGVRERHAKLVADSDTATGMTSIAFQECVHISTGSGV